MIIKASSTLRDDHTAISNLARETKEPICITKNGDGDLFIMNIESSERREQLLRLREKVIQAEQERIEGASTLSISQARRILAERAKIKSRMC